MAEWRECVRCVMDTSDPEISFDAAGVCSHCRGYDAHVARAAPRKERLEDAVRRVRAAGRGREYDCVMGVSGGVDSSYTALLAVRSGLRPLAVHLDNGWNSEQSVRNIQRVVEGLGLDLYTHVVDWREFRDLQRAFMKAGVVDLEMVSDHAIVAIAYHLALGLGLRFIVSGENTATEAVLPTAWVHRKSDLRNLRAIHAAHGERDVRTFPTGSTLRLRWWQVVRRIETVRLLNLVEYDKEAAKAELGREIGWVDYAGKHFESLITRFYQAHLLPTKFGIDKRRAHLSSLICAGQLRREEAVAELAEPLYDPVLLRTDREYFCKKLGFSAEEFDTLMGEPPRPHSAYASEDSYLDPLRRVLRRGR